MFNLDSTRTYQVQLKDQPLTTIQNIASLITTDDTIQLYDSTSTLLFTIDMANLIHLQRVDSGAKKKKRKKFLTSEQCSLIKNMKLDGCNHRDIAERAKVSTRTIQRFLKSNLGKG